MGGVGPRDIGVPVDCVAAVRTPYSTGRKGEPKQPALIGEIRGLLQRSGRLWWLENVLGAVHDMSKHSTVLVGEFFGLHVHKGRRFETNFPVHVDAALKVGERLRTCLGGRRRWARLDSFGRPVREACCAGNTYCDHGLWQRSADSSS